MGFRAQDRCSEEELKHVICQKITQLPNNQFQMAKIEIFSQKLLFIDFANIRTMKELREYRKSDVSNHHANSIVLVLPRDAEMREPRDAEMHEPRDAEMREPRDVEMHEPRDAEMRERMNVIVDISPASSSSLQGNQSSVTSSMMLSEHNNTK